MRVPDKIAMENVNPLGRVVADKYHGWTRSVNPIQKAHKIAKSIVKPR
jgi:hypothetical protein